MSIANVIIKQLTFKVTKEEILEYNNSYFFVGLIGTWVAGMGRYWDDKNASLIQHLGLGSIVYIFILSAFIWLIVKPLYVENWYYSKVLIFISLTSFPAILYAIPVERFFTLSVANALNGWFLVIVATWRLLLLYYFFKTFSNLSNGIILTITLMPICLIITTLSILNLHHVVYNIMSGIQNPSPNDSSYLIINVLAFFSALLTLPLLISYFITIYNRYKIRIKSK